jgi:hypothetical protein
MICLFIATFLAVFCANCTAENSHNYGKNTQFLIQKTDCQTPPSVSASVNGCGNTG